MLPGWLASIPRGAASKHGAPAIGLTTR